MSDPNFPHKHWRAVRAIVGEAYAIPVEGENVVAPVCDCKIVTENGEVWELNSVSAFTVTEERLLKTWDQEPSKFTRWLEASEAP